LKISKLDIEKAGKTTRILAGIVCFCGILTIAVSIIMLFTDLYWKVVSFLVLGIWLTHLSGAVSTTGYPPQYLYWTSAKRK